MKYLYTRLPLLILLLGLLLPCTTLLAADKPAWHFSPNIGQWPAEVLYRGSDQNIQLDLTHEGLRISARAYKQKLTTDESTGETSTSWEKLGNDNYSVKFEGGVIQAANIQPAGKLASHSNFIYPGGQAQKVAEYKALTIHNIYKGISLHMRAEEGGLKYEWSVSPGADASQITLRYISSLGSSVEDGILQLRGKHYSITDAAPIIITPTDTLPSSYVSQKGKIRYDIPSSLQATPYIIDPYLNWSTYLGKDSTDQGFAIASDTLNNVFTGGITHSSSGFSTSSTYQSSYGGGAGDGYIAKFNSAGSRLWTTYIGGAGGDATTALVGDEKGNIYAGGYSASSGLATANTHQTARAGGEDAWLAKFKWDGTLTWFTYYGGTGNDRVSDVAISKSDVLAITGVTGSSTGIATTGTFDATTNGNDDLFAARFVASAGTRSWGTYIGGAERDIPGGVAVDASDNIYVCGAIQAAKNGDNNGLATSGSQQQSSFKGYDGYVIKLSSTGSQLWSTLAGFTADDFFYDVEVNSSGTPYIAGVTRSTNTLTTGSSTHQGSNAGGADGILISYVASSGKINVSTYYGTSSTDQLLDLNIDEFNNMYICGSSDASSSSTPGIPTSDGYKTSNSGKTDGFIAYFNSSLVRQYATWFGGKDDDAITAVIKPRGSASLYFTGTTSSDSGLSTKGAFQVSRAKLQDAFVGKFLIFPCNNPPTPSISGTLSLCQGTVATYKATGGTRYTWKVKGGVATTTLNDESITVRWDTAGTQSLKVLAENARGCIDSTTVSVEVQAPPVIILKGDTFACAGETKAYSVTGNTGDSYKWRVEDGIIKSGQNTSTITVEWTLKGTGLVVVSQKSSIGCEDSIKRTVIISGFPSAQIFGNDTVCVGKSLVYAATPEAGNNYFWSSASGTVVTGNGRDTARIVWNTSGFDEVRLLKTNKFGCQDRDTFRVYVGDAPAALVGMNDSICLGDSVTLGGPPTANRSYQWFSKPTGFSSNSSSITVAPDTTTTYFLFEENILTGCSKADSAKIVVNKRPLAAVGADQEVCSGDSIKIGPTPVISNIYSWTSQPAGFTSSLANPTVKPTSTTIYILTERTPSGCERVDSVRVTVLPLPTLNLQADMVQCAGDSITLGQPGMQGFTYKWTSVPAGISSFQPQLKLAPKQSRRYKLEIVNDSTSCNDTGSVYVKVNPLPKPDLQGKSFTCIGNTNQYTTPGTGADTGNTYTWTADGGDIITGANDYTISVLWTREGEGYVTVTETTPAGCTVVDSVKVQVDSAFNFSLGEDTAFCTGGSYTLTAPANFESYLWNTGATTPTITVSQAGTYSVVINTISGCQFTDTIKIARNPLPFLTFGKDRVICEGDVAILAPNDTFSSYLWLNDSSTSRTFEATRTGNYRLRVTNKFGCISEDEVIVRVKPNLDIDLGPDTTICVDTGFTLSVPSGFAFYRWDDGSTLPSRFIDTSGVYNVTVTNEFGCSDSDTIKVTINYSTPPFIPDAFSPNQDFVNETWFVKGLVPSNDLFVVQIFNRWGEMLFESQDVNFNWDGTYKTKPAPEGAYVYRIHTRDCRGFEREYEGQFILFR